MMHQILLFTASAFLICWGIAHLIPTRGVVRNFGDISEDNKRIITMEWINEGVTIILIGVITLAIAATDDRSPLSTILLWINVVSLNVMSLISFFTGFKIKFVPFKLCPVIFTLSSLLILGGIYL